MTRARREQGVAEWTHADGRILTRPTITCCHCGNVTIVPLKASAEDCGGFCRMCMAPTCMACADGACTPFEEELKRQEARGRLFAAMEG